MCDFVSWIEDNINDKVYFISNKELDTYKGEQLKKYLTTEFYEDIIGHGAIKKYFNINSATFSSNEKEECTLKYPNKIPLIIVNAIKRGDMSKVGIPDNPSDLLNAESVKKYNKEVKKIDDKYDTLEDIIRDSNITSITKDRVYQYMYMNQDKEKIEYFWKIFKKKSNRQKRWQ
jgi:chromosome condensin MukBEF MukE localization factor